MKREVGFRMFRTEERAANDPAYRLLLEEYREVSPRFIRTLDTLPRDKREMILHYSGLMTAMYRKMLEIACTPEEE